MLPDACTQQDDECTSTPCILGESLAWVGILVAAVLVVLAIGAAVWRFKLWQCCCGGETPGKTPHVQELHVQELHVPAAVAPGVGDLNKFISQGQSIQLGTLKDAMLGIGSILIGGATADQRLAQYTLEGEEAIKREFMHNGSTEDHSNFTKVNNGTFGDGKTIDALMQHNSTKVANLQRHHVLALRLYTTSSYGKINSPMRTNPPTRPHPFAATTFFIFEGIKKLRTVEATGTDGQTPRTLWRGVSGLSLTQEFMANGGSELACMSTTASFEIAKSFALAGEKPMVFKYATKNCIERGADIAYISVYQSEAEVLYPPLTFLHFKGVQQEDVAGVNLLVIDVEAQIVGN